jgi:hypothetical protein
MFIVTHAFAPVAASLAVDLGAIRTRGERMFPAWSLVAVGLFGALPDLCTPHLSLEARYASWSHTLWFALGILPVAAMAVSFFGRRKFWLVTLACWLAVVLHLATDAVSGGIAWLQPWRPDVIAATWIPFRCWLFGDALCLTLTGFGLWLRPRFEERVLSGERRTSSSAL